MNDIEPKHSAIIKALADFIRQKRFKRNQYYEFKTYMLISKNGDVSFHMEYLLPVTEKEVWGDHDKEQAERIKCQNSLIRETK
jgi:hypothetical protein